MRAESSRNLAVELRKQGYTYKYIESETGISNSTLSDWLRDVPYEANEETKRTLGRAKAIAAEKRVAKRQAEELLIKREVEKEIDEISARDLFFLGLGLYWGEGSKTHDITRIVNSDPQVIKVAMAWFKSFGVETPNFFLILHLYPDSNIDECLQFWSEATSIPIHQFGKIQIDTRVGKAKQNKGKLQFGTAQLGVRSLGNKDFGVLLARRIKAQMETTAEKVLKASMV